MPDQHADIRGTDILRDRHTAVRAQWRAQRVKGARFALASTALCVTLGGLLAWTVATNNRLATKVAERTVVYAVLQPNGEFIASTHFDEVVPPTVAAMQVTNALWTYVQARDCFSSTDFVRQAYIAQAMSNERIGNVLHKIYRLDNPDAPQHVYGDKGITVHCEPVDPPSAVGDSGDLEYFRFRRWEDDGKYRPDAQSQAPIYAVTVRYRTGIYPLGDKRRGWVDPTTFNAAGVQVVDYPGAQPVNSAPPPRPRQENRQ